MKPKYIVFIGSVVMLVGSVIPWWSTEGFSARAFLLDGTLTFACGLGVQFAALKEEPGARGSGLAVLFGVCGAFFAILSLISGSIALISGNYYLPAGSISIGTYVAIIGAAIAIVGGLKLNPATASSMALPSIPSVKFRTLPTALTVVVSIGLAIVSLKYLYFGYCPDICSPKPCQPKTCEYNEEAAGFPFPMIHDDRDAGSPLIGYGKIGSEDFMTLSFRALILNVMFYSLVLQAVWFIAQLIKRRSEKL